MFPIYEKMNRISIYVHPVQRHFSSPVHSSNNFASIVSSHNSLEAVISDKCNEIL